jgi:hypothetical protein
VSILQYISETEFYKSVDPQPPKPGQLCWLPVPHIDHIPRILAVERSSPEEHEEVEFYVRQANQSSDFRASDRILPLKYLKLRSNEELLVQTAKKRRGVVIAAGMDTYQDVARILRQAGKKHLQEDSIFVVPLYSIQEEAYGMGFPPVMVARIQCLLYRQFFFLPGASRVKASVARFDRIQVVVGRNPHTISPIDISLSDEAFAFFQAMFIYCLTGQEDEDLRELRLLCRDAYPEGI